MTEAGKKWADKVVQQAERQALALHYHSRADLFIRAFCETLEERALIAAKANGYVTPSYIERGVAYDELKRDMLGE